MKRFAILILSIVAATSLCACGCTNRDPAITPSNDDATNTQTEKMPTETVTVPVPETNIPNSEADDFTTEVPDSTDGAKRRGIARFRSPMGWLQ